MCVIPNIYDNSQNVLDIGQCQSKSPESFSNDRFCEEQVFPFLLPEGRFVYKATREVSFRCLQSNISISGFLIILKGFPSMATSLFCSQYFAASQFI